MSNATTVQQFGKLRSILWPVHNYELKKLLPMFMLFLLIAFIYNLMRCLKITLVVTAPYGSNEVIPFLKALVVLPGSILFVYIFTWLSNRLTREGVFYAMVGMFLSFFALFIFVLYPLREVISLDAVMSIQDSKFFNSGLTGILVITRNWTFSLLYGFSELWATIVLSMLFWGFANEVNTVGEAKRFYALYALAANLSSIFAGCVGKFLCIKNPVAFLPYDTAWEQTMFMQICMVLVLGLVIVGLFWWINRTMFGVKCEIFLKNDQNSNPEENDTPSAEKMGLWDCFSYLFKSKHMLYVVVLVVSYNLVYNLADLLFTGSAQQMYPEPNDLNAFMSTVSILTGVLAVLFAMFISGNFVRDFGWTSAALIPPLVWLATSIGFFGCIFAGDSWFGQWIGSIFGSPLYVAVYFGAAQLCLGRSSKYTVFDETKELTFVPLPQSEQRKGKAVVDGIVSRLGKSSGSVVFFILITMLGELAVALPYIAVVMFTVIMIWLASVIRLGKIVGGKINAVDSQEPHISTSTAVETVDPDAQPAT